MENDKKAEDRSAKENRDAATSPHNYLSLFNNMHQGFCTIEVIFDENDYPYDFRFLDANNVFEEQSGLSNVIGRTMREIEPGMEETGSSSTAKWSGPAILYILRTRPYL